MDAEIPARVKVTGICKPCASELDKCVQWARTAIEHVPSRFGGIGSKRAAMPTLNFKSCYQIACEKHRPLLQAELHSYCRAIEAILDA